MGLELRRPERAFTIRQLCLEFNCTPRALRFYEDKGLLAPARQGLTRVYSHRDRARLQLILGGKRVGLSLAEIRDILELYGEEDGEAVQMAKALPKFRERIIAFQQQREDINQAISQLQQACTRFEAQLARVRPDLLASSDEASRADAPSAAPNGLRDLAAARRA